jgi:hypothetical protein
MEEGGWASPRIEKEKKRIQKRVGTSFFIIYHLTHYGLISKSHIEAGFVSVTVLIRNQFLRVRP